MTACCSGDRAEEKWNPANFFDRGISVEIFRYLLKQYTKIEDKECQITMKDGRTRLASNGEKLVEMVIKKHCEKDKCSYVEYLGKSFVNRGQLGKCSVFISHAWMYKFVDLVSAVEEFQALEPNKKYYFFLDYVAVNQFRPLDDLVNLQRMVTVCPTFLLVLLPWNNPIPLTRAWCIYEIASALDKNKEPVVTMPKEQADLFMEGLMRGDNSIMKVFMNLDSKNAEASVKSDLAMIRDDISQNMGGFNNVDQKVGDRLRLWLMSVVFKVNEEWPKDQMETQRRGNFLIQAGSFLDTQGKFDEALLMKKECVDVRTALLGPNHGSVLTAKNNLAVSYDEVGRSDEAIIIKEAVVKARVETLGEENSNTLLAKNNLAVSYDNVGKHEEALKLKQEILAIRERLLGPDHDDVLISKNNLAYSLDSLGRNAEVLVLNKEVHDIRFKKYGPNHPDTILSAANLGNSYTNLGKFDEAVRTNIAVFNGRAKLVGEYHRDTFSSLSAVVFSYVRLAKFREAFSWAKRGHSSAMKTYGKNHKTTMDFLENMNQFQEILKDPQKVSDMQDKVRAAMEKAAANPDAEIVKAIVTYKDKVYGKWPEIMVCVPKGGMQISEYLKTCDPEADESWCWVENAERKTMEHIPHQAATMWVKSKRNCNVIQTYLEKSRTGMWPTVDVLLPVEGLSKDKFVEKVDQKLNPEQYKIEDNTCQSLATIMPGTSVVWMKTI